MTQADTHFVYILECADKTFYIGKTTNMPLRLKRHNGELKGGAKYTRTRRPVRLVYSEKYQTALAALLKQKEISGVIFCQTLQTMTDPLQNAKIIIEAQKQYPQKPILPLFLGGVKTKKGVDLLKQAGLGCFQEPRDAALAASLLSKSDIGV